MSFSIPDPQNTSNLGDSRESPALFIRTISLDNAKDFFVFFNDSFPEYQLTSAHDIYAVLRDSNSLNCMIERGGMYAMDYFIKKGVAPVSISALWVMTMLSPPDKIEGLINAGRTLLENKKKQGTGVHEQLKGAWGISLLTQVIREISSFEKRSRDSMRAECRDLTKHNLYAHSKGVPESPAERYKDSIARILDSYKGLYESLTSMEGVSMSDIGPESSSMPHSDSVSQKMIIEQINPSIKRSQGWQIPVAWFQNEDNGYIVDFLRQFIGKIDYILARSDAKKRVQICNTLAEKTEASEHKKHIARFAVLRFLLEQRSALIPATVQESPILQASSPVYRRAISPTITQQQSAETQRRTFEEAFRTFLFEKYPEKSDRSILIANICKADTGGFWVYWEYLCSSIIGFKYHGFISLESLYSEWVDISLEHSAKNLQRYIRSMAI